MPAYCGSLPAKIRHGGQRLRSRGCGRRGVSDDRIRQALASGDAAMRKAIPETMFASKDSARLTLLQNWVLENAVTEIEMNERQFWTFVSVQPLAEKPWTTYMGRMLHVSDMPIESQKCLGLFDKRTPGCI
jgi:hypothetical protein